MNPYDFVRIPWQREPERHTPIWHHRLVGTPDQKLYSGHIEVDIVAETPLFIFSPQASGQPQLSMRDKQGQYYLIPGSSLKGLLRNLVETLGNGCLTLFDGNYEWDSYSKKHLAPYQGKVPSPFQRCPTSIKLCIACRMFGMLKDGTPHAFLGKVTVGDACVLTRHAIPGKNLYTSALAGPKPHHRAFYLDPTGRFIAGRKYYFHHSLDKPPVQENGPVSFGKNPNKYIQPLGQGTTLHFRLDFTNLEEDEFALLLLALTLEEGMRHKLGYGKPLGLGSVHLVPTELVIVDYATRYTRMGDDNEQPILKGEQLQQLRNKLVAALTPTSLDQQALSDLRRIWSWPPASTVEYRYPSKRNWFDLPENRDKRIAQTLNAPGDPPRPQATR